MGLQGVSKVLLGVGLGLFCEFRWVCGGASPTLPDSVSSGGLEIGFVFSFWRRDFGGARATLRDSVSWAGGKLGLFLRGVFWRICWIFWSWCIVLYRFDSILAVYV